MTETTHFVYPYIIPKDPVFGWELLYSIRSIYQNFKDPFDITIIGEIPSWVNTAEIKSIQLDNNYFPRVQSRTNQKFLVAAEMYPDIVVMHDDYYIMNSCGRTDLTQIRHLPQLLNYNLMGDIGLTRFQREIRHTYFELKKLNKPYTRNFCTHTPFYYQSDKLFELNKKFDLVTSGAHTIILENAYYNYFGVPSIDVSNFRIGYWGVSNKNIDPDAIILNHDEKGFIQNPWIITILTAKFSNKCRGEI